MKVPKGDEDRISGFENSTRRSKYVKGLNVVRVPVRDVRVQRPRRERRKYLFSRKRVQ